MTKLSAPQLKEIAELLESGMICYVHKETCEIVYHPDAERIDTFDEELWEEEIKKVENNFDEYIPIKAMESRQAFGVMESFVEEVVKDAGLANRLLYALNQNKPFQHFKYEIDYTQKYRQQWFDYKLAQTIAWVKEQWAESS